MPTTRQLQINEYRTLSKVDTRQFVNDTEGEIWIAPIYYGDLEPEVVQITLNTNLAVGVEVANVTTDKNVTLRAGYPIKFNADEIVIPVADVTLDATVATDIDIVAFEGTPSDTGVSAVTALHYNLTPLLSVSTGGLPDQTLTHATSQNRNQGLLEYHETVRTTNNVSMSGNLNLSDPSADVIADIYFRKIQLVYVIYRKPWYDLTPRKGVQYPAGQAFPSCEYLAPLKAAPSTEQDGFVMVNIEGPVNNLKEHFLLEPIIV